MADTEPFPQAPAPAMGPPEPPAAADPAAAAEAPVPPAAPDAPSAKSPPPAARIEALFAGAPAVFLAPIDELLLFLQREIGRSKDLQQAAELKVGAALLHWDGRGQAEAALKLLAGVDHPVAAALRLHAAIDAAQSAPLLQCADEVQRRGAGEEAAEVGELLMWRGEYARAAALLERAAEKSRPTLSRALALSLAGRYAEAVEVLSASADAQALLLGAHLAEDRLADPERARTLLRRVVDRERPAGTGAVAGVLKDQVRALKWLYDLELRRPAEAGRIEILRRKLELLGGGARLEAAAARPDALSIEVLGTALLLTQALERAGSPAAYGEAAALLSAVGRFYRSLGAGRDLGLGLHTALRARARVEGARGGYREAALALEELGRHASSAGESAGNGDDDGAAGDREVLAAFYHAYLRRAAELWDARVADPDAASAARARDLYQELFAADPADGVLALTLARILLQAGSQRTAALCLERHAQARAQAPEGGAGGAAADLLRAARAAEAVHDAASAARSLERLAPGPEEIHDRLALEALCRTYRRSGDRARLVATYRRLGDATRPSAGDQRERAAPASAVEGRRSAAYLSAAGALALEVLPANEAEVLLQPGAGEQEAALLPLLGRVLLLRKLGRHAELAAALLQLLPRVSDPETQADLHRQLGRVAAEHLSDPELARTSYRRTLELRPGDVVALHALARLTGAAPDQSVLLLRQAVAEARDKGRAQAAALLLCELAAQYLQHLRPAATDPAAAADEAQAVAAYEEALREDPACRTAALALVELHRKARRLPELIEAIAVALPLCRDDAQRVPLYLELGRAAEAQAGTADESAGGPAEPGFPGGAFAERAAERAIDAYARVLPIAAGDGPQRDEALQRLERLCRRLGRWELLCTILADERLAQTRGLRELRLLAEVSEKLERWPEVARYREEELRLLDLKEIREPRELLRAARALADLYEARLGQPEAAARAWERAYRADPAAALALPGVAAALERLYAATGGERAAELAELLGHELGLLESGLAAAAKEGPERDELRGRRKELLLRLGEVLLLRLDRVAEGTVVFEKVLDEWPGEPAVLERLAALYEKQERPDDLRRALEERARQAEDPAERGRVLLRAGELAEKRGDLATAQKEYAEAFALDPGNRLAFTSLERVCYRREQWPDAIRIYDLALDLVENKKSRAYRLGDLYARRGQVLLQYLQRPTEAAQDYLRALEFDAENDAIQAALERIHAAHSEWAPLISAYERRAALLRDDGKRVEVLRRAARVAAAKLRDIPEAIRLYQQLHSVDPTDSEALDALERHYERSRDQEKLIALLCTRLALSTTEQEGIALNMRIALLCEEGLRDHDRAIEAYRQVLEVQPSHREALDAMARLYEANERWAELIEVTRRQIRLTTDRSQKALLYFKCGSVMEAKFGKEDDAARYYEAAVKTSPSCLPAVHGLRDIYLRRQDWPRVTQTLELEAKLWTEDKERAGIYAHIGQIYRDKLHDPERAIQYYESALQVDKECLPANRALFEVFYERGDWVRAVPISQVLSAKVNREGEPRERSEFYKKRAIVADHAGDLRTAAESLVMALEIQPENMEALELLVGLCRRDPEIYDFGATFRELEKLYRRRGSAGPVGAQGLGLTLVARAALAERAQDIEGAEELLAEAVRTAPDDYAVTEALVVLNEKLRRFEPARQLLLSFIAGKEKGPAERTAQTEKDRARAKLRLAEMYSDALMEPEQALAVLTELCDGAAARSLGSLAEDRVAPEDLLRVARFRLVQELYLLGRYAEARAAMDALIELAVRPPQAGTVSDGSQGEAGSVAPPEELARYYDYLGRILEAHGEGAAAQRNYRRAVELDPAYSLPALALARRMAAGGDRTQAELLVREALSQAELRGDPQEKLRLLRGAARLLAQVDPAAAVEAYREAVRFATSQLDAETARMTIAAPDQRGAPPDAQEIVARETLDDRVALSDLLLQQEGTRPSGAVAQARDELLRVLQRDLRHAPAYKLLAQAYERLGETERAERVLGAAALLGYGEGQQGLAEGRGLRPASASYRGTLSDELRRSRLLLPAMRSPLLELLPAVAETLVGIFPSPWAIPEGGIPASKHGDAALKVQIADLQRLHGIEAEVLLCRGVPGGVLALEGAPPGGRPLVVLEQALLDRADAERRFLLGRALEPLRGGYAFLLRLGHKERAQVTGLLVDLLMPEAEREAATQEFYRSLPRKSHKLIERLAAGDKQAPLPVEPEPFLQALPLCADRAGLLSCDDISAAVRMMARLQGEELAMVDGTLGGGILLGQVAGGAELVRFFLSDGYHDLRTALKDSSHL